MFGHRPRPGERRCHQLLWRVRPINVWQGPVFTKMPRSGALQAIIRALTCTTDGLQMCVVNFNLCHPPIDPFARCGQDKQLFSASLVHYYYVCIILRQANNADPMLLHARTSAAAFNYAVVAGGKQPQQCVQVRAVPLTGWWRWGTGRWGRHVEGRVCSN